MSRIFLLSPANSAGARAQQVMSERADFPLARQLRSREGAPLGDLFSFFSSLYFRGKLAYARAFANPAAIKTRNNKGRSRGNELVGSGVFVIVPGAGLIAPDTRITLSQLRAFAQVDVRADNRAFRVPLEANARALAKAIGPACEVVLLGSIASPKYVDVLTGVFGDRLLFPPAFVGRGDMSRGGLMLRCVMSGFELPYAPIVGAVRHGERPPKLEPIKGILSLSDRVTGSRSG